MIKRDLKEAREDTKYCEVNYLQFGFILILVDQIELLARVTVEVGSTLYLLLDAHPQVTM